MGLNIFLRLTSLLGGTLSAVLLWSWPTRVEAQIAICPTPVAHRAVHATDSATPPTKPIESVTEGDVVLAVDEVTGEVEARRVVQTFERRTDHLRLLTVRSAQGEEQLIETTDEHPFWVNGTSWVRAGDLKVGDQLTEPDGQVATLESTVYEPHPKGIAVYNFEVEDLHAYFVSAQGARAPPLLAHNACNETVDGKSFISVDDVGRSASSAHRGVLAHGSGPSNLPVPTIGGHTIQQMQARGITQSMINTALQHGKKYYDPKNNTINHILEGGVASGKSLIVGQSTTSGKIATVIRASRISKRLIPIQ